MNVIVQRQVKKALKQKKTKRSDELRRFEKMNVPDSPRNKLTAVPARKARFEK